MVHLPDCRANSAKLYRLRTGLTGPSDASLAPSIEAATAQPTRPSNQ